MPKRTISATLVIALLLTLLNTFSIAASVDDEWEYYLGSQHEYGYDDTRDCWQKLFRKNKITGEKQQLTFGQCISKYMILEDCIIYNEYSGDYMDGAMEGETYGLHRINKDGSNDIFLDEGYEIEFNVRGDWIYYTNGKDIRKIKTDGSGKATITLNEKNLWLVGNMAFFISGDYLYSSLWLENNGKCEGSLLIRINLLSGKEEVLFKHEVDTIWTVQPSIKHQKICYWVDKEEMGTDCYLMNFDGTNNSFLFNTYKMSLIYAPITITNDWIYFGYLDMMQGEVQRNEVFRYRHDGSGYELVYQNLEKPFYFWKNKVIFYNDLSYSFVTEVDLSDSILELIKTSIVLKVGTCDTIAYGAYSGVDQSNYKVIPYIDNGRTMVPVRFISEMFGSKVDWNPDTKTVTIEQNGKTIEMIIGEKRMHVDNKELVLDVAPQIKDGRTFLPLRALCETLNKNVFWEDGIIVISNSKIDEKALVKVVPYLSEEFYGV